jgi:hypothetical protein
MSDPIRAALDKAAEALWQAESLRAAGVQRRTEWHEEGEHTRQKWRFMAAHGNAAFLRALPDGAVLTLLSKAPDPYYGWRDTLADAVLAAAKEDQK